MATNLSQEERDKQDHFENTFLWVAGVSMVIALLIVAIIWGFAKREQSSIEPPVSSYSAVA